MAQPESSRRRRRLILLIALISSAALGATWFLSTIALGQTYDPAFLYFTALGAALSLIPSALVIFSRVAGSHTLRVRVALGGPPKSGKTVLATMMILSLSHSRRSKGNLWTASSETELAVSQGERLLARGFTSVPTRENEILHFETRTKAPQSTISRALNGPAEIEIDIIDSAGELWQRLGREERMHDDLQASNQQWSRELGQIPLVESTYFARVAESHALVYLVGADDMLEDAERVRLASIDAVSALRMLRVKRQEQVGREIGVNFMLVVSKADLLDEHQRSILSSLLSGRGEFSSLAWNLGSDDVFSQSLREMERLVAVADSLADRRGGCMTSSLETAMAQGLVREWDLPALKLPSTVTERLARASRRPDRRESSVLDPLRWVLERELGGRYRELI